MIKSTLLFLFINKKKIDQTGESQSHLHACEIDNRHLTTWSNHHLTTRTKAAWHVITQTCNHDNREDLLHSLFLSTLLLVKDVVLYCCIPFLSSNSPKLMGHNGIINVVDVSVIKELEYCRTEEWLCITVSMWMFLKIWCFEC